ncbi:hypothetical protein [Gemmobacter denitrificans]|uniref:XRE family transcriptional regulator n=1 Tax=Gemmobacter denitrificans TaxID=3123040 RepID=A0ABU8BRD0_9RHOB
MPIDETAIRLWAERHECRRNLPILVRRLLRETVPSLVSMRFPGNEAVDLAGLDGQAESSVATRWVPAGPSIWELGCNLDPRSKAQDDYQKRTDQIPEAQRLNTHFVFVTPRRWNTKDQWLTERRQASEWASVNAYDAIDLETWLEEAPVTSRWLGELLGVAERGVKTPEEWWQAWATASVPPITKKLVATRRHNERATLLQKLRDREQIVPVQADDKAEAVAFVVATLIEEDALDLLDKTLVASSADARIPSSSNHLIVISDVAEGVELDFGDRRNLTIVRTYPKGRLDVREPLLLSHVPSETFRSQLEEMGIPRDEAETLARKVGHSVPVLRRQLSRDPDVRRPVWARDRPSAKRLLPFALAGSWVERENVDDASIVELLGEIEAGELVEVRDALLALDDAPIARYGNVNVVVSQLDAIFAVGPHIERGDLDRFFALVPELLGDRDPALDLPQDQWYMAGVLGHGRKFSNALLSGVGDALCILSVHGSEICGNRLGVDLAFRAGQVVRDLMLNATEDRWLSIRGYLRTLAEAAPSVFLDCLEAELRKPEPPIRAIMGTTEGFVSGECLRTNLLWALELLAWHPVHFSRVAEIVFELRRLEAADNWSNSPKSTARSLFLAWLPATALSVGDRMQVLRRMSGRFRNPVLDVCMCLLPGGSPGFATRTARPHWRELAAEVPEPTNGDVRLAAIEASHLMLDMSPFTKGELERLLEVSTRLHPDDFSRLILEVERWSLAAGDEDKAELRHQLRRRDVMRAYQEGEEAEELAAGLHRMEVALEPQSPTARHRWLFESPYVEWRALVQEEGEGRMSWQERNALVEDRRRTALAEIEAQMGLDAIMPFALSVKHPELVAQILVPQGAPVDSTCQWIEATLRGGITEKSSSFLRQLLWSAAQNDIRAVVGRLMDVGLLSEADVRQRFAEHLPGTSLGWEVAEMLGPDVASAFWSTASIRIWDDTTPEAADYAVARLLQEQRPRSAFSSLSLSRNLLSAERWVEILQAISRGEEPDGPFPNSHHLDEVFQLLDAEAEVADHQIAGLELPFVPLLCSYGHRNHERTLAVHREMARDPALFVQLLSWHYRRRDGAIDPDHEALSAERRKFLAELAYHTLEGWNRIPGIGQDGTVSQFEFNAWAEQAMQMADAADRREVAEIHFGALLARFARKRAWDDWLPTCVLDFLDRPECAGLRERFDLGVRNARGVTTRSPFDGGEQERRLAGRYRELAGRYGNSHPRVAEMLVTIAESYEWDARREDERAAVGERWHP